MRQSGFTLLELMVYLSLASVGIGAAVSLYAAERVARGRQAEALADTRAVSAVLFRLSEDLRAAERAVPREAGPGALVFLHDGTVAVWFDRKDTDGEIHRKVLGPGGTVVSHEVVGRGLDRLSVTPDGPLFTARAEAGAEARRITVRRRHAR